LLVLGTGLAGISPLVEGMRAHTRLSRAEQPPPLTGACQRRTSWGSQCSMFPQPLPPRSVWRGVNVAPHILARDQSGERAEGTASLDQARPYRESPLVRRRDAVAPRSTACGAQATLHSAQVAHSQPP